MAKDKKKTTLSQYLVWGLLGLLGFSLIGFGAGGFGGSAGRIGTVAGQEIEARDYGRALRDELRALSQRAGSNVSLDQARQIGVPQQVLSRLISTAAVDAEAERLGLSAGDERVAAAILEIPAFQGGTGFDREAYRFALENAGLTIPEFEEDVRREAARGLITDAVAQVPAPEGYADLLMAYIGETRDVTWAPVPASALGSGVAEPTAAEVAQWYLGAQDRFRLPPSKSLTVFHLEPEVVARGIEPEEAAVRALYEADIAQYQRPERRLAERLVFPDRAAADAAAERLAAGASFDEIVEERGLTAADIDLDEVTRADLGAAAEPVFALPGPDVTGVVETDLGPAIFRVNAVLDAIDVPFEEARGALAPIAALEAARRDIDSRLGELDDLLAGGATVEELSRDAGATPRTIEWSEASAGGLNEDPAFRAAAAAAREGDFPEIVTLEDGGLFALRVDAERPSRVPDLEEIEPEVLAALREERRVQALTEAAEALAEGLAGGGAPEGVTLRSEPALTRDEAVEGAPAALTDAVFEAQAGEAGVVSAGGEVAIWRLDAVNPADMDGVQTRLLREAVMAQGRADLAQDVLGAYVAALQNRAEVQLDRAALAAIEAQFP